MTYQSVHTGPEVDAAVAVLNDVQEIRDEVDDAKETVVNLAGQVQTDAGNASSDAATALQAASDALDSKNAAYASEQAASGHAANADSARAQAVVARNGSEEARDSAWEAEGEVRYLLGESEATIDSIRAEILRQKYGAGPYPSLDIGFVGARVLDRRVEFIRASNATYWDEMGVMRTAAPNEPRIDYDPVTGECLGLLIEGQGTNLVLWSSGFDQDYWTKENATVIASPDLSISADSPVWSLSPDSSNNVHAIIGAAQGVIGKSYVMSVIAKPGTFPRIRVAGRISGNWATFPQGVFDLSTGTVQLSSGDKPGTMKYLGNGYYLCSIYGTCANDESIGVNFGPVPPDMTTVNFDGSIYQGNVYILAAQMEEGTSPTSYIKTEASQVTRAADGVSIFDVDSSDWFNSNEGTLLVDSTPLPGFRHLDRRVAIFNDGTTSNQIGIHYSPLSGGVLGSIISKGGELQYGLLLGAYVDGDRYVQALRYSRTSARSAVNGVLAPDGTISLPNNITRLEIGSRIGMQHLNGHIRRITYYPRALSDAQLVELTTI